MNKRQYKKSLKAIKSVKIMDLKENDVLVLSVDNDIMTLADVEIFYNHLRSIVSNEVVVLMNGVKVNVLRRGDKGDE